MTELYRDLLNFSQQDRLFDPDLARPLTVIGAGSVGSNVVNMAVRIGVRDLTVYDHDFVDSHNVGPSLYGVGDIGKYKVNRLKAIIERTTGVRITPMCKKWEGEALRGSVIACVDNMEIRQALWESVRKSRLVEIYIDTRVAKKFIQVFAVRPDKPEDVANYEPYLLYDTKDAAPQMCGEHSIIFISSRTASIAVEALSDFWRSDRTEFTRLEQLGSDMFIHPKQES